MPPAVGNLRVMKPLRAVCLAAALVLGATPSAWAQQPRLPFPLRGAAPAEPTAAERAYTAGETLLRRGDYPGARARFDEARRLDPRDARAAFYLGEWEFQQGHFAEALPRFAEALALDPTLGEAHAQRGASLRALGRLPEAIAALTEALRVRPTLGEAHTLLGLCHEDQGNPAAAAVAYRAAMSRLRDDPNPALLLATVLVAGNPAAASPAHTEALRALREAVRRADRDVPALSTAGPLLRRLGDAPGAVRALTRARDLSTPPSAALLGELAQSHAAAGQWPLAMLRVDEAIRAAPDDVGLIYLRGLIRAGAGQRDPAQADFREVVRRAPNDPVAARARARLAALAGAHPGRPDPPAVRQRP